MRGRENDNNEVNIYLPGMSRNHIYIYIFKPKQWKGMYFHVKMCKNSVTKLFFHYARVLF